MNRRIEQSTILPYSPGQLYALVNDVAAYPQFLPWCEAVQVHDQGLETLSATLTLAKAGVRQQITTRNEMVPGSRIHMRLMKGPFRHLSGLWEFHPHGDDGVLVKLLMEFEFKNRLVAMTLGRLFDEVTGTLVSAFRDRAHACYGGLR